MKSHLLNPNDVTAADLKQMTETELKNLFQQGCDLYAQNKFDEALAIFNMLLRVKENNIEALNKKAQTHITLHQDSEAMNALKKIVSLEPNNHRAHFFYGVGLKDLKKHEDAIVALNECLKLRPDFYPAHKFQGWAFHHLGQMDNAKLSFEKAVALDKSNSSCYSYGVMLYIAKQYKEALPICDKSLELNANCYRSHYYRACTLFYLNRKEEAILAFKKVIEVAPDNHGAWRLYADGLLLLKQYDACFEACEKSLSLCAGNFPAIELKNKVVKLVKNNEEQKSEKVNLCDGLARSFRNNGNAKLHSGDYKGAIRDFTEYLRLKPDDADAFYWRGNSKRDLEDLEGAIADYTEYLRLKPDDADAFYWRGGINSMLGNFESAIEDLNHAIRLNPQDTYAFSDRAWAKLVLGHHEDALTDYNTALDLDKDNVFALNQRSMLYRIKDKDEKADADRQKAISLGLEEKERDNPLYKKLMPKAYLICAEREMKKEKGDLKAALIYCDEALRIQPNDQHAADCRAQIIEKGDAKVLLHLSTDISKIKRGDFAGAIEDCTSVIRLNPNEWFLYSAYANRGLAKIFLEHYEYALEDYDQAITLRGTTDPRILRERAMLYRIMGLNENAERDIKIAGQHDANLRDAGKMFFSKRYTTYATIEMKKEKPNFKAVLIYCEEALRLDNNNLDAGHIHDQAEQRKSETNKEPAEILTPESSNPIEPVSDVDDAFERGLAKLNLGDNAGAIIDFTESLRLKPDSPCALHNRGIAKCRLGNYTSAIEDFDAITQIDPYNFINRAWAKLVLGNYKDALTDYNTALDLSPDCDSNLSYVPYAYLHALHGRALLYRIIGKDENADADIEKAKSLNLKDPDDPLDITFDKFASKECIDCATREMKKENGNPKTALIYCEEALRLDSNNPHARHFREQALDMMAERQKAEAGRKQLSTQSVAPNIEDKKNEQEKIKDVLEKLRTMFLEEKDEGEKIKNYDDCNTYLKQLNAKVQLIYKEKQKKHVLYVNGKPLNLDAAADEISKMLDSLEKSAQSETISEELLERLRKANRERMLLQECVYASLTTMHMLPEQVKGLVQAEITRLQQEFSAHTAQSFKFFPPAADASETPAARPQPGKRG